MKNKNKKLRIYITLTEEPLYINKFLTRVIDDLHPEIIGIAIEEGSALKVDNQSQLSYLFTQVLISEPLELLKKIFIKTTFNVCEALPYLQNWNPFSIRQVAKKYDIPLKYVDDLNSSDFKSFLNDKEPDIIINQAQSILKKEFINIPQIGVINRHGSLLPQYRGRFAPFWAYMNGESETGVSIHFVEEGIDSGPLIVQKRVKIDEDDTIDSLLKKLFAITPDAMISAINKLKNQNYRAKLKQNREEEGSYYSSPKFRDALKYRKKRLKKLLWKMK